MGGQDNSVTRRIRTRVFDGSIRSQFAARHRGPNGVIECTIIGPVDLLERRDRDVTKRPRSWRNRESGLHTFRSDGAGLNRS